MTSPEKETGRVIVGDFQDIAAIITAAVAAEREACARIAETTNVCGGPNGQPIAAAIRERSRG